MSSWKNACLPPDSTGGRGGLSATAIESNLRQIYPVLWKALKQRLAGGTVFLSSIAGWSDERYW